MHDCVPNPLLLSAIPLIATLACATPGANVPAKPPDAPDAGSRHPDVAAAERLIGLGFTDAHRELMREDLKEHLGYYERLRKVPLANSVAPALLFNPFPPGFEVGRRADLLALSPPVQTDVPGDLEALAFRPVRDLSELIRTRKITSEALTRMYLARLKRFDPKLHAVVTLTEDLALERARQADREIAAGRYRGPLHGIPYGAKDLLATRGIRTTWGSVAFKDQVIDDDATVVKRLEEAGAVLVAKLTLGELAWGDVWFGGQTKNPWNLERGSSGSSAGSASAVAAGLVPFAIGSETLGSIVSPSTECGVTGLRPGFGRVSRAGAMALSWSMDKIGPICRTVEDCAIVFDAIRGPDGRDPTVVAAPFWYAPTTRLDGVRLGYLAAAPDQPSDTRENDLAALETLRALGAELVPFELPPLPIEEMTIILEVEAAAAFDELTRSGRDALLVRQVRNAWPNVLRQSRFIPAVEYIQANRIRALAIEDMAKRMKSLDAYVAPSFGNNLALTNLTGHPAVVVPHGFTKQGVPTSITFVGQLLAEGELLRIAAAYQGATGHHRKHPPLALPARRSPDAPATKVPAR